jgi:hypothetical protein
LFIIGLVNLLVPPTPYRPDAIRSQPDPPSIYATTGLAAAGLFLPSALPALTPSHNMAPKEMLVYFGTYTTGKARVKASTCTA